MQEKGFPDLISFLMFRTQITVLGTMSLGSDERSSSLTKLQILGLDDELEDINVDDADNMEKIVNMLLDNVTGMDLTSKEMKVLALDYNKTWKKKLKLKY
jgi:hypothetical protein